MTEYINRCTSGYWKQFVTSHLYMHCNPLGVLLCVIVSFEAPFLIKETFSMHRKCVPYVCLHNVVVRMLVLLNKYFCCVARASGKCLFCWSYNLQRILHILRDSVLPMEPAVCMTGTAQKTSQSLPGDVLR